MAKTYRVNLSPKESARIEAAADAEGLTPADWIRHAVNVRASNAVQRAKQRAKQRGAEVPAAAGEAATIEVGGMKPEPVRPRPPLPRIGDKPPLEGWPRHEVRVRSKRPRRAATAAAKAAQDE